MYEATKRTREEIELGEGESSTIGQRRPKAAKKSTKAPSRTGIDPQGPQG